MNFSFYLTGGVVAVLATVAQTAPTWALEATQIKQIADNIIVRIDIEDGDNHGSGVIIARNESNYYVLTAKHVVQNIDAGYQYTIIAPDGESYYLDNSRIEHLDDVDLAVISFTSDRLYKTAQIERSEAKVTPGIPVYINGFPQAGQEMEAGAQFTSGSLTGMNEQTFEGYDLVYSNFTRGGMSGGPVLNQQGHLIGIHGLAAQEKLSAEQVCQPESPANDLGLPTAVGSTDNSSTPGCVDGASTKPEKIGLNLGISIFTFLERAASIGMDEILDTTAVSAPQRPEVISPTTTTGTGCSGVVCP